ncbi:hypothetical protein QOZ80_5AG0380260 [Eleusine coracana subsp. coracana]|nr:hypothetical protein QOZ80_5AG0380260 [Eleusine coracana subsp. coracana]
MEIQSCPCSWQPRPPPRRDRRRPHGNTNSLSSSSSAVDGRINGSPACTNNGHDQPHQITEISQGIPHVDLPKDVLRHIYSLLPLRDAARAACASHKFLRFWRCYPNLAFNQETLAASRQPSREDRGKYVFRKAQQVLENHSGSGVKALRLNLSTCDKDDIDTSLLDQWLRAFVKPGIAELTVMLPDCYAHEYNFPYSILESTSDDGEASSSSIQSLYLASCGFHHPTPEVGHPRLLGCSRSLWKLCLRKVSVNSEELEHFLSRCYALERMDLSDCNTVTSLKIPRVLKKLSIVRVQMCRALQTIESDAPMISNFHYEGGRSSPLLRFSLGDSLETKELDVHATSMVDVIQYAGSNLPSIAPNLETLMLSTVHEKLKAPTMMLDKFQKLKHLVICLGASGGFGTGYDFVSLACFLDACPSLEIFTLRIEDGFAWYKKYVIVGKPDDEDASQPQHKMIPEFHHGGLGNLRKATITGFCSAKSLIELTC